MPSRNVIIPPTLTSLSGENLTDRVFGEHLGLQLENVRTLHLANCGRGFLRNFFAGRFENLESLTIIGHYVAGVFIGVCAPALHRLRHLHMNTMNDDDVLGICMIAKNNPFESVEFSSPRFSSKRITDSLCVTLVAVVVESLPSGARAVFEASGSITIAGARVVGLALALRTTPLRLTIRNCPEWLDVEISSWVVAGSGVEFTAEAEF